MDVSCKADGDRVGYEIVILNENKTIMTTSYEYYERSVRVEALVILKGLKLSLSLGLSDVRLFIFSDHNYQRRFSFY